MGVKGGLITLVFSANHYGGAQIERNFTAADLGALRRGVNKYAMAEAKLGASKGAPGLGGVCGVAVFSAV